MKPDTVRLLLDALSSLAYHAEEHSLKIVALEQVLESYPEIEHEYSKKLRSLRENASTAANSEVLERGFATLRKALLQDQ